MFTTHDIYILSLLIDIANIKCYVYCASLTVLVYDIGEKVDNANSFLSIINCCLLRIVEFFEKEVSRPNQSLCIVFMNVLRYSSDTFGYYKFL